MRPALAVGLFLAFPGLCAAAPARPAQLQTAGFCLATRGFSGILRLESCQNPSTTRWQVPQRGVSGPFVGSFGLCLAGIGLNDCDGSPARTWRHALDGRLIASDGSCLGVANGLPIKTDCAGAARWLEVARNDWSSSGLNLGFVGSPLIFPSSDPEILYLIDNGRVRRSEDGGKTWSAPLFEGARDLSVDPRDPNRLFLTAPELLYRSLDGGRTWLEIFLGSGAREIARKASDPDTIAIAGFGELARSRDGGQSFERLTLPSRAIDSLEYGGNALIAWSRVFVCDAPQNCSAEPNGLFRSDDDGTTWRSLFNFPVETSYQHFAVDSADSQRLIFARGLPLPEQSFRSVDGGTTWLANSQPLPAADYLFDPRRPGTLIASLVRGGVRRSQDSGDTWSEVDLGVDGLNKGSFQPVVSAEGDLLLPLWSQVERPTLTLARSSDGGASFTEPESHGLIGGTIVDLAIGAENRLYAVVREKNQIAISLDRGLTWTLRPTPACAQKILADTIDPELLFLGGTEVCDPASETGYLFRSRDGGETWETVFSRSVANGQLTSRQVVSALSAHKFGSQVILLASVYANYDSHLLRSIDHGGTWQRVEVEPLWNSGFAAIVGDELPAPTLYGAGLFSSYRSIDLGLTWTRLPFGHAPIAAGGGRFLASSDSAMHLSLDRGATYSTVPLPENQKLAFLEVSNKWPYAIAAVTAPNFADPDFGTNLFLSNTDGATWAFASAFDANYPLWDFLVDPTDPQVFYAANLRDGVFQGRFDAQFLTKTRFGERFLIEVEWRDFQGRNGRGWASDLTYDTGHFWFFSPNNVELGVKILDGRAINGHYWVFFASLTNVGFALNITDRLTGTIKTYVNDHGTFASQADTSAFPALDGITYLPASPLAAALSGEPTIRLNNRFEVRISWRDFIGQEGQGLGSLVTADTGSFFFFTPANVEAFVKVLDGRAINGRFWVFIAGLSNVQYRVEIRDTVTNVTKVYENTSGTFASIGDTAAF